METADRHPDYIPKNGVSHWTFSLDTEDVFL